MFGLLKWLKSLVTDEINYLRSENRELRQTILQMRKEGFVHDERPPLVDQGTVLPRAVQRALDAHITPGTREHLEYAASMQAMLDNGQEEGDVVAWISQGSDRVFE